MQVQFGEQIITCQSIHKRTIAKKHFSFHIIYYKTAKEDKKNPQKSASLFSQLFLIKCVTQHQIKAIIFASWPQKNNWRTKRAKIVTWVRTDSRIPAALLPPPGVKGGKSPLCGMGDTQAPQQ